MLNSKATTRVALKVLGNLYPKPGVSLSFCLHICCMPLGPGR